MFDWKLSLNLSLEIMAQVVPVPGAIEDGVSGEKLFLSKKNMNLIPKEWRTAKNLTVYHLLNTQPPRDRPGERACDRATTGKH